LPSSINEKNHEKNHEKKEDFTSKRAQKSGKMKSGFLLIKKASIHSAWHFKVKLVIPIWNSLISIQPL
jgi:hypothetical protein